MSHSKPSATKLIGITSVGTLLEWAEYTFYGYLALKLSSYFFPAQHTNLATLKTYGIFAIGYVMRPLGALFFGYLGDHLGRKPALILSMLLMGISTALIGCLPSYEAWGLAAPLCLLVLRMFQGIAVSGEFNGAGIFLIEKLGPKYPCLAGSWTSSAAALGMVIGGLAAFIVTLPHFPEWAWRIPFFLGGTSCFVALWMRKDITESEVFIEKKKTNPGSEKTHLISMLIKFKSSFIYVGAIAAFTGIFVYILNIYIVSFLHQQISVPAHHASLFAMFGEMISFICIPLMAYLADRWHPEKQYMISLLLIAAFTPVIFQWLITGNYLLINLAMITYGILNGMMCGPIVKLLVDAFPVQYRYTGISFAWSFSAAIFSGTAPMIALYLNNQVDWLMGPAYYVSMAAILTFTIILYVKKVGELNHQTYARV